MIQSENIESQIISWNEDSLKYLKANHQKDVRSFKETMEAVFTSLYEIQKLSFINKDMSTQEKKQQLTYLRHLAQVLQDFYKRFDVEKIFIKIYIYIDEICSYSLLD